MVEEANYGERNRAARIAEIGRRANDLRRRGWYGKEEVAWLAEYLRSGGELGPAMLVEVEMLVENAERLCAK